MTAELVEFLRARETEREQGARAATPGPWRWDLDGGTFDGEERPLSDPVKDGWGHSGPDLVSVAEHDEAGGGSSVISSTGYDADNVIVSRADAEHIARHDPAWVLADVAAKRRIIDMGKTSVVDDGAAYNAWEMVLRLLALSHADHDQYRPEWAVDR